jgi:ankyrin repeat protein
VIVVCRQLVATLWIAAAVFTGVSHAGANEEDKKQFFELVEAFDLNKIRTQLDRFPELANARGWKGFTALQLAVGAAIMNTKEEKEVIRLLLEKKADANARNNYGSSALHMVIHPAQAELLLSAGADLEAKGENDETPLHSAVTENEREDVVSFYLEKGANVCARDKFGVTAKEKMSMRYKPLARLKVVAAANCSQR